MSVFVFGVVWDSSEPLRGCVFGPHVPLRHFGSGIDV